jgi:hypothetical protein
MHVRQAAFALTVFVACSPLGAELSEIPPPGLPAGNHATSEDETSSSSAFSLPDVEISGGGPDVPYDRVFQKSVHNAYARSEPLLDQLVYHRVRSVELDIHTSRAARGAATGDWFVYHEELPFARDSSCSRLSDCLGQLAAFHASIPNHEVVTLFVDLKDDFSRGHRPNDLDAAITEALGRENVLTPADVVGACEGASTVRGSVTGACHFPTLRDLRGKFLVAVTGGSSCDAKSPVSVYGGKHPRSRAAFLAPDVDASCEVERYDAHPDVVFLNMPLRDRGRALAVRARGLVARVYGNGIGGVDTARDFSAARNAGATHVATNMVNFEEDAWSMAHLGRGFPFGCPGCSDMLEERGSILGVRAQSGDQGDTADSAYMAYQTDAGDATWSALVSVPSSHVDPLAKGCLVARASEDPGAASIAICRPFDDNPPRAQVRLTSGGPAQSADLGPIGGLTLEAPAFLKLALKNVNDGTDATALASGDGIHWVTVMKTHVAAHLPIRGVTVSSHGGSSVKGLFANLVREHDGTATRVRIADLKPRAVGRGVTGDAFDGVFPPSR